MIVALTGGIGSGKTTIAKMFANLGVPVYNSDQWAKKLMGSSKKLKTAITQLLGENAYSNKELNKKYISQAVFNNKILLQKLNEIVHPPVREHFSTWASGQNASYVIQEAAIIFENNGYEFYDKIILVTAPIKLRIERVVARDGASEEEVLARMNNQWSDKKKMALSDFVIENIDLTTTQIEVENLHNVLLNLSAQS
ncbi:dephospho-CoA kinase [uncultured Kriegella sp.]|uniref:dephospho-CoA kinase n=1 Tax=uncultured Kriegella sp. TaxID=1798910 RepID=UPI0030D78E6F|tara:strand:- start:359240 stop:359830 length:591 start_codon:yes stop_codon:yes gene_type:complete